MKGSAYADKSPHHASFREYRRGFIESYVAFKVYVELHNQDKMKKVASRFGKVRVVEYRIG